MGIAHLLEDFDTSFSPGSRRTVLSDVQIEDIRLAAFESGYAAGWDDAAKTSSHGEESIAKGLEHVVQDLAFPYAEALTQMLSTTKPVFQALFEKVLPENADPILAAALSDRLWLAIESRADVGLELVVPEGTSPYFDTSVFQSNGPELKVTEDATLDPGQAVLRLDADTEEDFDLTDLSQALRDAIESTLFQIQEDLHHG